MFDFLIYFSVIGGILYFIAGLYVDENQDSQNKNEKSQIIDRNGNILETNKQRDADGNFIDKYREGATPSSSTKFTQTGNACPRCGSTNVKAKRSRPGMLISPVFSPKTKVKCLACNNRFDNRFYGK